MGKKSPSELARLSDTDLDLQDIDSAFALVGALQRNPQD